ncbi:MAG: tRNA lysidine(34) synthetase TilS [Betaproteobacteria bacterium]
MSRGVDDAIKAFAPTLPLAIGFSGGADSTALLLACARKWPQQVSAIHVHHGLQTGADDFARHCEAFCAQLQVPLVVRRVDARHAAGQSPEDAARRARYAAFRGVLQQQWAGAVPSMALAHHADDQVETLLLALSRGAGLPGLSAMPATWERDGVHYHRPLLGVPGGQIRAWLQAQAVDWLTDPSNAQQQFTRNRIRAQLLPVLDQAFPQFRQTFARSAAHAAQAQGLLRELAEHDLQLTGVPPSIGRLQTLTRARQANALRHWLKTTWNTSPSAAQLAELLDQLDACRTRGHGIRLKLGAGFVRRSIDLLDWYNSDSA